jgi:hypothetical protein
LVILFPEKRCSLPDSAFFPKHKSTLVAKVVKGLSRTMKILIINPNSDSFFDKTKEKLCFQYDKHGSQEETMDYLEFIARVTSHIPDKGQVINWL